LKVICVTLPGIMAYEDLFDVPVRSYPEALLRQFVVDFLVGLGASQEEARIVADGLTTASLWWHPGQGQGLEKLIRYHRRVKNGGIVPGARMEWVKDGPSHALLDAGKGFGYVAAHRAMERAVTKAREDAVALVGVRNSNHFGIAGYHALQAARAGMIGWAFTNAGAEMAPTGSAKAVLGTNPWGIAVPRANQPPIVLDMALTMSGKGMMRWYDRAGKSMPESWALTPEGRRTTIPAEAMSSALLPIGEYKGYGLSLVTDILTGVMTGALFGLNVFQEDTNFDVGHVMMAINPDGFIGRPEFERRLEELLEEVKMAPPVDPKRPVMLPGEREWARMEERRRKGVPISRETVERLRELAEDLSVDFPL
jgi:LDH2 family malate/lactate/ureidoglycolate dehydrogenase